MKRIIICCDGTWNDPDNKEDDLQCQTNVFKLSTLVSPVDLQGIDQVVYYQDGVGTGNYLDKIAGGAFGIGLSKNIENAYRFLVNNYAENDELWFFGFSRGAYTVRSLIGLIRNSGLLKKKYIDKFPIAYELYKEKSNNTHPNSNLSNTFENEISDELEFIVLFDIITDFFIPSIK